MRLYWDWVKAGQGRGPGLSSRDMQGPGCGAVTATGNHTECKRPLITAAETSMCLNWPQRELA